MKKRKKKREDKPIGKLKAVEDFLPPPEALAPPEKMVKVTLALDQKTCAFFKSVAQKFGAKYQRMMREVLYRYAKRFS